MGDNQNRRSHAYLQTQGVEKAETQTQRRLEVIHPAHECTTTLIYDSY